MACVLVCMPTYNGSKYLREAMDSVLGQSFDDYELLVVDDCSKDATAEIVKTYRDSRIHLFVNEHNRGLVGNWNECLAQAKNYPSKYLQFFFQDDVMLPCNLERKVTLMEAQPSAGVCFSASCVIDAEGAITMRRRPLKKTQLLVGRPFAIRAFRSHNLFGEPSNVLLRKSVVDKVGEFNGALTYTPDWEYWERMAAHADVCYVDELLTRFRVAHESTTSSLFAGKDHRLQEDEQRFVRSLLSIPELNLSKGDVLAHNLSTAMRSFGKRLYFAIH